MRELRTELSLESFRDDLVYTEAALAAQPVTKTLADPVVRAIGDIEGAEARAREAARRLTRASAEVAVADAELDSRVMAFATDLLAKAKQDRESTIYRKFFPKESPSMVIRLSFAEERSYVATVTDELAKLPANDALAAHQVPLREANEALGVALDARRQAAARVASLNVDEADLKERINRLRVGIFAELQRTGADNGRNRKWPESYFRAAPSRREATDDVEQPVVIPTTSAVTPPTAVPPSPPPSPTAQGSSRTPA